LKKALLLVYVVEIPVLLWLLYMEVRRWEVSTLEGVLITLLVLAYGTFHAWAIVDCG
jgi:F0F1-type ATP synthase assembly protein I